MNYWKICNLDNKADMAAFNFSRGNSAVAIPQIPTLRREDLTAEKVKRFVNENGVTQMIAKENWGGGGFGMIIKSAEEWLEELKDEKRLMKYQRNYVLQPYYENVQVWGWDAFLVDGEVMGEIIGSCAPLTDDAHKMGYEYQVVDGGDIHDKIKAFNAEWVRQHKISGFCGVEFLFDLDKQELFLMEVNPRISGTIACFEKERRSPYFYRLVMPYLARFGLRPNAVGAQRKADAMKEGVLKCPPWNPDEEESFQKVRTEEFVQDPVVHSDGESEDSPAQEFSYPLAHSHAAS